MLLFRILHPGIPLLTLRIVGAIAIVIMIMGLGFVEFSRDRRRIAKLLSPLFVLGFAVVAYVVLIAQGSIK
jgi:hypothetical protein